MCTAILNRTGVPLVGRTLDLECSYGEDVVIIGRHYISRPLFGHTLDRHFAILGMATVRHGTPLLYDAVNERGLCMAALHFPRSAVYHTPKPDKLNIPSYALISHILGHCDSVASARRLLLDTNVTQQSFSPELPASSLHWLIADRTGAIVAEPLADGLRLHDAPLGVLTNEPPFPFHEAHVTQYLALGPYSPPNSLCPTVPLSPYARGFGGMGLPGDYSSPSRFVRAVFAQAHTVHGETRQEETRRMMDVLGAVSVPAGCVRTERGEAVRTVYQAVMELDDMTYHVRSYRDDTPCRIHADTALIESSRLLRVPVLSPPSRDEPMCSSAGVRRTPLR